MRYGLPYKGSKNAIAEWIVNNLPPNECFVDLFFGGSAVTHCAMLKGKYKRFIINDIDGRLPKLFVDCAHGKYTTATHPEWISREEFNKCKADDVYIALIWSFGNNGIDYLYGADIEEYKHAYHILVFENDPEPLKRIGVKVKLSSNSDVYGRYLDYSRQMREMFIEAKKHEHEIENYERLQTLERLESCDILTIKVKSSNQPLDLKRMSYTLTHTSFFRVLGFDWYSRTPKGTYRCGYGRALGYDLDSAEKIGDFAKKMFGNNAVYLSAAIMNSSEYKNNKDEYINNAINVK